MSKKEEIVHARVPKDVYHAIDEKAEELQKESYGEVTRSDVVRLAITEFISNKPTNSSN